MDNAIEIENLTFYYKNKRGIEDLNLIVPAGEIFGVLGPNGAGKTTAMKLMTGLIPLQTGDVRIFGHSILTDYERAMSKVGCIIETVDTFTYMTAYDNMKLCGRYYDVTDSRIDECLELTNMIKYKKEKTKFFSLGMRQRLGLSMALLSNPPLLILDEPLNGLDVEGMREMREIVANLKREKGTTFFISSHLIHDVELTCERVGIILNGVFRGTRTVNDILKDFSSLENYYISEAGQTA